PCDRAIPPPDIHKIRRQITQSFSKAPRFSAMNLFFCRSMPAETRGASPARVGALRLNRQTAIDDVRPRAAERAQARGVEFRMIRGQPASAEPG
ncbi:hypothetical protein, partial [Burkholderia pseudomallei]|uniref:hypothetical protein n=1 Tax=Burkholderia pseudomallei TaxID=28450 RepID=UPI001F455FEE